MTPNLNWKELAALVATFSEKVEGLFVDRIVIPERSRFPDQYVKSEWAIRLTGRRQDAVLLLSVRPRNPYLVYCGEKGPNASQAGTRSPFDLALGKALKGRKLLSIETLPRERTVILWFSDDTTRTGRVGLVLTLIPASPEALLIADQGDGRFPILARSRSNKEAVREAGSFTPPDGSKAPAEPSFREELVSSSGAFLRAVEKALDAEAFELRLRSALRHLKDLHKQASERARQSETAAREAEKEADWQRYGDLLKAHLGQLRKDSSTERTVTDWETTAEVTIPVDPKLTPQEQVEKFYSLARRKKRRREEALIRLEGFREAAAKFEKWLSAEPTPGDWPALEKLERAANITPHLPKAPGIAGAAKKTGGGWLGKIISSKDGLPIYVGRSRDENLELTFKHARGNDIWMHVRGRPGSHVLVPVQPGKSVPLETLLDAATLCIFYSGGEKWGKTEVDYTFKKYVKRIKDSTEASYTNNKTLIIEPDPARLKRLLNQ